MIDSPAPNRLPSRPTPRQLTVALALLAYVPTLLSAPGRVPGDTKLSLYLDPGRLIADSIWTWDTRQFSGWVPHQNVGYVWPSGPFYWILENLLTVPDWIAHRLWIGTLLFLAGTGVAWFSRRLGTGAGAVAVAAVVYQLSPYVLPYISRTSALLLPWSLLGWILGVSVLIARHRRARDIAAWAILIASTGGLNATALAMIAPAPLVWILAESRGRSLRSTLRLLALLATVAIAVNTWWMAGLVTQGRFGAAVLSYSETLPSTAATSTTPEVLRGLGYWIFYDRSVAVPLTSAATPYMTMGIVLIAGLLLVGIGLIGLGFLPAKVRRPAGLVLALGTILSVGAHPFTDPSPLWSKAADNPTSAISLALRSSTRAAPLVVLVLALGCGAFAAWIGERIRARGASDRRVMLATLSVCVLAIFNLPALVTGRLIDPTLERPDDVPIAWTRAADFLDARLDDGFDGSVLLLPGIESAAYRWGYPVDPILPALTQKRFISRDWLPLGSAPYMDALYALDDAFQEGRVDPAAVAPMARLLGADTVMVVNSHQYERFGSVRPERAALLLGDDPPGLTRLADFGEPTINTNERFWSTDEILAPARALPEITLWAVDDPAPTARMTDDPLWVRADGTGLVDAASAGLVDGRNVTLDPATFDSSEIRPTSPIVVTDGSRRRAHHWRSSQEVWGATEPETGVLSIADVYDQRLPITSFSERETTIRDESIEAVATGYGTELSYWPEYRPTMALDGDSFTAWLVGDERDPRGQILTVTSAEPLDSLVLERSTGRNRWITAVETRSDGGTWTLHPLDDVTTVELPRPSTRIDIRIANIEWSADADMSYGDAVGFREVLPIDRRRPEVVRIPPLVDGERTGAFVFTRLTADPLDEWRSDPEHRLIREFTTNSEIDSAPGVTTAAVTSVDITAGLSARASTTVVGDLFGLGPSSSDHLTGSQTWASWSAHDGDPDSAWWSAVGDDRPVLTLPISGPIDRLTLVQPPGSPRIRRVIVSDGSDTGRDVAVDDDGSFDSSTVDGDHVEITVVEWDEILRVDRRTGRALRQPLGIAEVLGATTTTLDTSWTSECRDDLVTLDEAPLSIRLSGRIVELLAGKNFDVEICSDVEPLRPGVHRLESASGLATGVDIDRIVVDLRADRTTDVAAPVTVESERTERRFTVPPCSSTCVIEGFDGWNTGWSGDPLPSAAGRNVWTSSPATTTQVITSSWRPQRLMWIGLAVSATAIFAALIVAAWFTRRPRPTPVSTLASSSDRSEKDHPRRFTRHETVTTLGVSSIVAIAVSPLWILVPVIAAGLGVLIRRRPLVVLARVGLAIVLLGLLFVVAQQIRTGADPGFGWPSVFERAHRPMAAGLLMWSLALAVVRGDSASLSRS